MSGEESGVSVDRYFDKLPLAMACAPLLAGWCEADSALVLRAFKVSECDSAWDN